MRRGVTLAEVLVVVGIIAVLAGLGLPAGAAVLRLARRTACTSNLRQVGMCVIAYAADHDQLLPAEGNCGQRDPRRSPAWFDRLPNYIDEEKAGSRSIFQCAAYRWSGPVAFAAATPKSLKMNAYLDAGGRPRHWRMGRAKGEWGIALFIDAVAGETGMGQWGHCLASAVRDDRHPGAVNILCLDGTTLTRVATPDDHAWSRDIPWLPAGYAGGP
jgi:prepilin-type N-terminal cleavage/methylation domain-containing protein